MKKVLLLALCLLLAASLAACVLPSGEAETTPATTPPATSPPAATAPATPPATSLANTPRETTPEATPPATSPPVTVALPITETALREGFALRRPEFTLKEIVETEAGWFLFSMGQKSGNRQQEPCQRMVDFLDKQTGTFALHNFSTGEVLGKDFWPNPLMGYRQIDDTSLYLFRHSDIYYDSGHRGFPWVTKLTYADGQLFEDQNGEYHAIFYPLAMDMFYMGMEFDVDEPVRVLSATFASAGGVSLLFDLPDAVFGAPAADLIHLPRVNLSYDENKRQMTLSCPRVLLDKAQAGAVRVPADDPYIASAEVEAAGGGVRVAIQLKEETELYMPRLAHFGRAVGRSPGVLFEIAFYSREVAAAHRETLKAYVMDDIAWICKEQ